ncbi:MAG: DUF3634 family protein [Candidatus Oceanisphaera merdipullorum]|nr:DUF3634 family protein [Candidatus Oceanisphaera merdipullorum]
MFSSILCITLLLFGLLHVLRRRQESFRIRLQDTQLTVISGQPPAVLLQFCRQLTHDIRSIKGSIRGIKKDGLIVLICSHSIPIAYRQDIYLFWEQQLNSAKTGIKQAIESPK